VSRGRSHTAVMEWEAMKLDLLGTGRQGVVSWLLRNQEKDYEQ
jgi:hypothetical protein